jgi:hypothetical protein
MGLGKLPWYHEYNHVRERDHQRVPSSATVFALTVVIAEPRAGVAAHGPPLAHESTLIDAYSEAHSEARARYCCQFQP